MCIGLVGRKHSVLKTVLACLNLCGNLHVLLHGMGCVRRVAWNGKQPTVALVDSGAMHCFVSSALVAKFELPL